MGLGFRGLGLGVENLNPKCETLKPKPLTLRGLLQAVNLKQLRLSGNKLSLGHGMICGFPKLGFLAVKGLGWPGPKLGFPLIKGGYGDYTGGIIGLVQS